MTLGGEGEWRLWSTPVENSLEMFRKVLDRQLCGVFLRHHSLPQDFPVPVLAGLVSKTVLTLDVL